MRTPQTPTHPAVRKARPSDARALVALQHDIYRESSWFVGDGPPSAEALVRRLRSYDPEMSLFLVADGAPEICAWLELHRLQAERLRHVAILTLAVAVAWRRQGLGRALLRRAYHWADQVGVHKISLNVRANNLGAVALYRAEGFELEGCERDHIRLDDGFEDNLIMARFVGPGRG